MILVDTSVWVDHLRTGNSTLADLLEANKVVTHDFVIGELALGGLTNRATILRSLQGLARITGARPVEVLAMIENRNLSGRGIGYVDAHLLAAVLLSPGTVLWTLDKRLDAVAAGLEVAGRP